LPKQSRDSTRHIYWRRLSS